MRFAKCLLITLFAGSVICSSAQNLVSNPSFETISSCPPQASLNVHKAIGWARYGANTSDFYHQCGGPGATTPWGYHGYQVPSHGVAYPGIICWTPATSPNYREFIGQRLSAPLTVGACYRFTCNVNLADMSEFSCNHIGMMMTKIDSFPTVRNVSHVALDTVVTDDSLWHVLTGTFMAEAPYNHLVIGNFFGDSQTDTTYLGVQQGNSNPYAYWLIDEVSLILDTGANCRCNLPVPQYQKNFTGTFIGAWNESSFVDSLLWEFGDGDTSTDWHVGHTYQTQGQHIFKLYVYNNCGVDSLIDTLNVVLTGKESEFEQQFALYYQSDEWTLKASAIDHKDLEVKLFDIRGRTLNHRIQHRNDQWVFKRTDFDPGVYLVNATSLEGFRFIRKIIFY